MTELLTKATMDTEFIEIKMKQRSVSSVFEFFILSSD